MNNIKDDILSYREMCDSENVQTLQRGMNYRMKAGYSVVLMSQRSNAPYKDKISSNGLSIEYEGHDISRVNGVNPKKHDQITKLSSGKLTQNGYFCKSVDEYKSGNAKPEIVKIYEKILPGVWSLKGFFDLIDYKLFNNGSRNVYRFLLRLSSKQSEKLKSENISLQTNRIIPSEVKKDVWKRDGGKCVLCGSESNLHFDHELPFSKGGTSLTAKNIRLLCMKHNLQKSDKIE